MLNISDKKPLGSGKNRKCYVHPDDPTRCVKVIYDSSPRAAKMHRNEIRYYERLNKGSSLKDWSGLPHYYGTVETDMGTGYVYELICDYDGKTSQTMEEMINQCQTMEEAQKIMSLIYDLKKYIYDNCIVVIDLRVYNIMCRRVSENKTVPVICDNIGEKAYIPVAAMFSFVCHSQQKRRWDDFMRTPGIKNFLEKFNLQPIAY